MSAFDHPFLIQYYTVQPLPFSHSNKNTYRGNNDTQIRADAELLVKNQRGEDDDADSLERAGDGVRQRVHEEHCLSIDAMR